MLAVMQRAEGAVQCKSVCAIVRSGLVVPVDGCEKIKISGRHLLRVEFLLLLVIAYLEHVPGVDEAVLQFGPDVIPECLADPRPVIALPQRIAQSLHAVNEQLVCIAVREGHVGTGGTLKST